MTARSPLAAKLALGACCFVAINVAVGFFAYEKQRQLAAFAISIYDNSVTGLSHVDQAQVAFLRLASAHAASPDPAADPGLQADLGDVLDEMDIVIARASSSETRRDAEEARAELSALGRMTSGAALPATMQGIEMDLASLVKRTASDGLHARAQVELFTSQSVLLLLASVGVSALFMMATMAMLGRVVMQRRDSLVRMAHMAGHDALTGLANRTAFGDAMRRAAARAGRSEQFAVLCIDLDRFKQVNDTLGHPIGDAVLRAASARLRGLSREVDTVARLGGDGFAVVQVDIGGPVDAGLLAQRVIDEMRVPFDVQGHRVVIGATVGVALAKGPARDTDTLLRNADLALCRAKQEGRGAFRFFEPEMDEHAQARRSLELDLRGAPDRGEFELHYQPLVSVRERRIAAFEALIRWRHPVRGMVAPNDFIPLAEEIGLIVPIGGWVLRTACREAARWPEPVGIAVNLSAVQFTRGDVVEQVATALRDSGLAASRLEVEITETVLLHESQATVDALRRLHEMGVRISMDDFGTGYSSLSYLRRFPFDKLKIDRSFVRDLADTGESAAIVRAIAGLGRSLGIAITAEGVETEQQMSQLVLDGCTELQGYFFSPPCAATEVPRLLVDLRARQAA